LIITTKITNNCSISSSDGKKAGGPSTNAVYQMSSVSQPNLLNKIGYIDNNHNSKTSSKIVSKKSKKKTPTETKVTIAKVTKPKETKTKKYNKNKFNRKCKNKL
jgi:hypothetical protein